MTRLLGGVEVAVPAAGAVGPRYGQAPVPAHAPGDAAGDGPGDAAVAVGADAGSAAGCRSGRPGPRASSTSRPVRGPARLEVDGLGVVGGPAQGQAAAPAVGGPDSGPQIVSRTVSVSGSAARDGDDLSGRGRRRASRRASGSAPGRRDRSRAITRSSPVAVAVGEAPGHLAVAAGDQRRRAGQGDARPRLRRPPPPGQLRRARYQMLGRPMRQVHVVGQQRAAVGGQRPATAQLLLPAESAGDAAASRKLSQVRPP